MTQSAPRRFTIGAAPRNFRIGAAPRNLTFGAAPRCFTIGAAPRCFTIGAAPRQGGFALLVVLWTVGLLALLVTQFAGAARTEVRVALNLRAHAVAQSAADGGVHEAVLQLLRGAWVPDGQTHGLRIGDTVVNVRATSLALKINPNNAPPPVLAALLSRVGVEPGQATALARAIVDWRTRDPGSASGQAKLAPYLAANLSYGPANRAFDSIEEIGLVAGMTAEILARMKPFLSVYQEGDAADEAADTVEAAAEDAPGGKNMGWQLGSSGLVMVVSIQAAADRFIRQSTVRLRAEPGMDRAPYEILTWERSTRQ